MDLKNIFTMQYVYTKNMTAVLFYDGIDLKLILKLYINTYSSCLLRISAGEKSFPFKQWLPLNCIVCNLSKIYCSAPMIMNHFYINIYILMEWLSKSWLACKSKRHIRAITISLWRNNSSYLCHACPEIILQLVRTEK